MKIVKLPQSERAPEDSDSISLNRLPDGRCALSGSVLDGEEAVAMIGGDTYDSMEEAEAAGLAWAGGHHVQILYVAFKGD